MQMAVGVSAVVAIATAVKFRLVYETFKDSGLQNLEAYVTERAAKEEARFQVVQTNLKLVRGQFLKRLEAPVSQDELERKWDYWYRKYPDGAWRSREQFSDPRKASSMWADRDWPATSEMRRQTLIAQELCDEMLPGWVDVFPSYYFQFPAPGLVNVGVDVLLADWSWKMPGHFDTTGLEWIALALPKGVPKDEFSWTGLQQDSIVSEPLVSTYLPVVKDGVFLASVGHNMPMNQMIDAAVKSSIAGASHYIFRADGRLIAHPTKRAEILKSKGLLTAVDCGDETLASIYRLIDTRTERRFSGFDPATATYYNVARLAGPEWFYVTTMSNDFMRRQALDTAKLVLWSGLISLVLVLGPIALVLRIQVARPLSQLIAATKAMSSGKSAPPITTTHNDELAELAVAFREMNAKVLARELDLLRLNADLEHRVTKRTDELAQANERLAESLKVEKEMGELRASFVALVSHEFRTPLEVILTSSDILDRYLDRLSPEKRKHYLESIHASVKRMRGMMEDVLLLGRVETGKLDFKPENIDLQALGRRVTDEILSATARRCPVVMRMEGSLDGARGDESLLHHVLANLLSNAVKYSPAGTPVTLQLVRRNSLAVFIVTDRGRGIPAVDRLRLFKSFQRGSNVGDTPGTGLGLLIVRQCVEIHGGTISLESEEGFGAVFTVAMPLFEQPIENILSQPTPSIDV